MRGRLWRLADRLRRRLPPLTSVAEEPRVPEEIAKELEAEELREFLAHDLPATRVDPDFREGLRQKLWALMQQRHGGDPDDRLD